MNTEKLYQIIGEFHTSSKTSIDRNVIMDSIEKFFSQIDQFHSQNFLNFLVEEYDDFSNCKNYFERVRSMANDLINSLQLSSKVAGITSLTKLWLRTNNHGIEEFVNYLIKMIQDTNRDLPYHIKTICSNCLLEIYYAKPEAIKIPYENVIEMANDNFIPTAFPELALAMKGQTDQISKYYEKRWWYCDPFENYLASDVYQPELPAVPNDHLLLHDLMKRNKVSKETALAMINSPLSGFGVSSILLGFKNTFSLDSDLLFTPFDTKEQIALKIQLLPPKIESIESNKILLDFVNQDANSPLVSSIFEISSRFNPDDLFVFFRKYYKITPQFDHHWVKLYNEQTPKIQHFIQSFLLEYPKREATIQVLLNNKPTLSIINEAKEKDIPALKEIIRHKSGSIEAYYAEEKLKEIDPQYKEDLIISKNKVMNPRFTKVTNIFTVINQNIHTSNKTAFSLSIEVNNNNEQIFAAAFHFSNPEYFEEDGIAIVPSITNACQIQFEMKPKKAGNCLLKSYCIFINLKGETIYSPIKDVSVNLSNLLVPHESDFDAIWSEGNESRLTLPMKFNDFYNKLNTNLKCTKEANLLKSLLKTPDNKIISIKATPNGNNTSIQFKAPSFDLLLVIDEYFKKFL